MSERPTPRGVAAFWRVAPDHVRRAAVVLSAAVSLTDEVATWLLTDAALPGDEAAKVVECLRECGFAVARNSEWQFTPEARAWLRDRLHEDPELARRVHGDLLTVAKEAQPDEAGDTVPAYLTWPAGRAYHTAPLAPTEALALYADAYEPRLTGEQWLLGVLAEEQQQRGVLAPSAIEPAFLRGMTVYREGDWQGAERLLRRVADSREQRIEVAISKHVVGVLLGNRRYQTDRARQYLEESLAILRELGDRHGQAQVLHSLGKLLGDRDPGQAREYLDKSLAIERELGKRHGQAQVLHSLGKLLGGRDPGQARQYLDKSLAIGREIGHRHHQAQVLHSLGKLLGGRDPGQARQYLEESLAILHELGDRHGQAQVLNTRGDAERGAGEWEVARACYQQVLDLSSHPVDRVVAHLGLAAVAEYHDSDLQAACEHMREAVAQQEQTGRQADIRRHRTRLRKLEQRLAEHQTGDDE